MRHRVLPNYVTRALTVYNGLGDACDTTNDTSSDSDGVIDTADNYPVFANPD
ncbi:MAG: hypothetical protein ACI8VW_000652 [bacterium]|jgi:hypothetical protein